MVQLASQRFTVDPVVRGPGFAIQRVGPIACGDWRVPLNAERIHDCRRLYRQAQSAHPTISVLSVFRGAPFELDLETSRASIEFVVSVLSDFHWDALVCPLVTQGFLGTVARMSSAQIKLLLPRRVPFFTPGSLEEGLIIARRHHCFSLVPEDVVMKHMAELEVLSRT